MFFYNIFYFILFYFYYIVSFLVCLFLLIAWLKKININYFNVILLLFIVFFVYGLTLSYFQFLSFKNHPISQFLLPPYQSIFWFLSYIFNHYFKIFFFRIIGGLVNLFLVYFINLIFKNTIFYKEEYKIIFMTSLMIDFPLNLLLILFVFFFVFLNHILYFFRLKSFNKDKKISTKTFWLPIVFLFIIINIYIIKNLDYFKFLYKFFP
jgi:hypothetical protein